MDHRSYELKVLKIISLKSVSLHRNTLTAPCGLHTCIERTKTEAHNPQAKTMINKSTQQKRVES